MRRTIEIRHCDIFYKGNRLAYVTNSIREYFGLNNSRVFRYVITIVEDADGDFRFTCDDYWLEANGTEIGYICKEYFDKLFFEADPDKRYKITVKKVRKKKAR